MNPRGPLAAWGSAEKSCAPFQGDGGWGGSPITSEVLATGPFRSSLRFEESLCPFDGNAICGCIPAGPTPLDLQFQVTGGTVNGPFEFCVTEVAPLQAAAETPLADAGGP